MTALYDIHDPEIGMSIVDLDLIKNVDIGADGQPTEIKMVLTTPFCPWAGELIQTVKQKTEEVVGPPVKVTLLADRWEPPPGLFYAPRAGRREAPASRFWYALPRTPCERPFRVHALRVPAPRRRATRAREPRGRRNGAVGHARAAQAGLAQGAAARRRGLPAPEAARARAAPAHGLRGGALPERGRVLEGRAGDDDDHGARRRVHQRAAVSAPSRPSSALRRPIPRSRCTSARRSPPWASATWS